MSRLDDRLGHWLRRLFEPVTYRPSPPPRPPQPLLHGLVVRAVLADALSGPDSTLADKVVYVAYDYAIAAAAHHGATKGAARRHAHQNPSIKEQP